MPPRARLNAKAYSEWTRESARASEDMVGHQAVAQEARTGTRGVMAEKIQVRTPIIRRVEDGSAIIATLGDMMGNARKDDAGTTGHKNQWNGWGKCLRKMRLSPFHD